MPQELQEFYNSLPGTIVNNSRQIVRQTWERIKNKHPMTIAAILRQKFGVEVDYDFIPGYDDGEPPVEAAKEDPGYQFIYGQRND